MENTDIETTTNEHATSFELSDLRQLKYEGKGKHVVWSPDLTGFGVRVYPSGKKVWYVQWNRDGRQGSATLGDIEIIPLREAREAARKLLAAPITGKVSARLRNEVRLSEQLIATLTYPRDPKAREPVYYWDWDFPHFGVKVHFFDTKHYVVRYRRHGQDRVTVLGKVGEVSFEDAMAEARETFFQNWEAETAHRKPRNSDITLTAFTAIYMDRHAKVHKRSWRTDEGHLRNHILPVLGKRQLCRIRHMDIVELHQKIGETQPYVANRVIEVLSTMFNLAKQWEYLSEDERNPAVGVKAFPEYSRERFLSDAEARRLLSCAQDESEWFARMLSLFLLTGLRKSEMRALKWDYIDWERKELNLPARRTKSGRSLHLPLDDLALGILQEQKAECGSEPFVWPGRFPGTQEIKTGTHIIGVDKIWWRVRKRAGLDDIHLHDLRRTCGSWMAQNNVSLAKIGQVLNQTNEQVTAVYARFANQHVRDVVDQHGDHVAAVLGLDRTTPPPDAPATIHPLIAARREQVTGKSGGATR